MTTGAQLAHQGVDGADPTASAAAVRVRDAARLRCPGLVAKVADRRRVTGEDHSWTLLWVWPQHLQVSSVYGM